MKGVVFTEFLEYVEECYSPEMADKIIATSSLCSYGVYTSVGTYPHQELVKLISALSTETGRQVPDLIHAFGKHLFGRLIRIYPMFLTGFSSSFELLRSVQDQIHVKVRKLYPDAELPTFEYQSNHPDQLIIIYRSKRPFKDLAAGMIEGCIEHFGEAITLTWDSSVQPGDAGVRFVLERKA
ncbi:MAG: heme NO-binding domain-containing protein [Gammaproteobacteria bacterium]|nr:heme NO-binding domain-containing protein [Gammaproteobacteria bacterium]